MSSHIFGLSSIQHSRSSNNAPPTLNYSSSLARRAIYHKLSQFVTDWKILKTSANGWNKNVAYLASSLGASNNFIRFTIEQLSGLIMCCGVCLCIICWPSVSSSSSPSSSPENHSTKTTRREVRRPRISPRHPLARFFCWPKLKINKPELMRANIYTASYMDVELTTSLFVGWANSLAHSVPSRSAAYKIKSHYFPLCPLSPTWRDKYRFTGDVDAKAFYWMCV